MALLELRGVHAGYKDVPVLRDVSLAVDEGQIVAVVGSNGAGKTTLLRTISGLLAPTQGQVLLHGESIAGAAPHQIVNAGVVQVPEGRQLFPHMTVAENLEMGAYGPRGRRHATESLAAVLTLFPALAERRKQLARTLSGGEQQMLAIGRALMGSPQLLLMDELSLGLAPLLVEKIFDSIREINSRGTTILLVEQNVVEALNLAHRAYVLENGRIVMEGQGKALLEDAQLKEAYLGI